MTAPRLPAPAPLAPLLDGARRRWRTRHLAAGLAITVVVVALVLVSASLALEAARFAPRAIGIARLVLGVVTTVVVGRWLVWPLLRPLPDDRLALYLEERVPQLAGAVLSAVTLRPHADAGHSAGLERGLVTDAARRLETSTLVPVLERPATVRALSVAVSVVLASAALFLLGPAFLRTSAARLLMPWQAGAAAPVYAIAIEPQSLVVPRGSDVQLNAALSGFASEVVDLLVRRGTAGEWEHVQMSTSGTAGRYVVRLLDVAADAEFYVEAAGVRSPMGRITVRDLPGVQRIGVELRFPAYTGLAAEVTDDGGDIAAPGGTTAILKVHATRAVKGGTLVFDDGSTVPLAPLDDSTVTARIGVRRDGFYRVELTAADGTVVRGTVEYAVDALDDAAPTVRIRQPGRDLRPTNVDEVLIDVEAVDDYGIGRVELVYRVNGGPETAVTLSQGTGARPREVIATHTLFLEELPLTAGDVVSYYARTLDNDARAPKAASSDIQFLTIRPFSREYRQNQQGGGGGEGGPQDMNPGSLVQRQRDIVAATFKVERDRPRVASTALRNDVSTLHLSQGRLRSEVGDLLQRVMRPAAQAADTSFRILAEVLPKAAQEMKAAEELLVTGKTSEALAPEQRALQWLEKAEAAFREVQVSMQQQGGGGGGGGGGNASDLADLLELETDKMRNQYDQVQRAQQQQQSQQADATLERLKQLAARQQQELARQRASQQGASSGGGSQRQLADEAEAAARQLERLAREQQSPQLEQPAQEMRRAADAMRRSAASGGAGAAQAAADRLQAAQRALEEARQQSTGTGMSGATAQARALAEEQRGVQRDVEQMMNGAAGADRAERQRRLDERKAGMEERLTGLARDLERMARDTRASNPSAARAAQLAAAAIRDARTAEKIRFSRDVLRGNTSANYARTVERAIQQDLDSIAERVAYAAGAAATGRDSAQRSARALAQARDLVRGLSSLEERLQDRGPQPGQGTRGQPGGNQQGATPQGSQRGAGQPGSSASDAGPQGGGQRGQQGAQGQTGQQGQGAQQGQGSGGGQGTRTGQAQGGMGAGGARGGAMTGGAGQGAPGAGASGESISVDEARQLSRELAARREAAQQLRRAVGGTGVDTRELDRAIARLNALDGAQVLGDPAAMRQLRDGVIESLKAFEFTLRQKLSDAGRGPVTGSSDNVPAQYREMVDEYFRGLSQRSPAKPRD